MRFHSMKIHVFWEHFGRKGHNIFTLSNLIHYYATWHLICLQSCRAKLMHKRFCFPFIISVKSCTVIQFCFVFDLWSFHIIMEKLNYQRCIAPGNFLVWNLSHLGSELFNRHSSAKIYEKEINIRDFAAL